MANAQNIWLIYIKAMFVKADIVKLPSSSSIFILSTKGRLVSKGHSFLIYNLLTTELYIVHMVFLLCIVIMQNPTWIGPSKPTA